MPEITETTEIPMSPDAVWRAIGGFGAVGEWHPMLERVELESRGARTTRVAHAKDGSEQVERLLESDPSRHSYKYCMERSAMPVREYFGELHVEPDGADASVVVWSARFDLAAEGDGKTIEAVRQFIHAGLEGLGQRLDGREPR